MRLRLRLIWLVISSLWRGRLGALDESILDLTVLPNDVDVLKITSDRYIALMDLGRVDLILRTGLIKAAARRKWVPLATFITIRFRYPLKVFEKYQLHTRIIYWDDDTFYIQQQFVRQNRTIATAYACATMLGPDGAVPSREMFAAVQANSAKPPMPGIVAELSALNSSIHDEQRDGAKPRQA